MAYFRRWLFYISPLLLICDILGFFIIGVINEAGKGQCCYVSCLKAGEVRKLNLTITGAGIMMKSTIGDARSRQWYAFSLALLS